MYAAEEPPRSPSINWWRWPGNPKFVGIGETGLDYHYTADSAAIQAESLRPYRGARQTGLPLIVHSRDADADMARILTDEHAAGRFGCADALLYQRP